MDASYCARGLHGCAALCRPLSSRRLLALASDDTLVEQMWRGNEAAFTVAFERHAGGLLSFCRHMVGSLEEAEDALQHTFVSALSHLQRRGEREIALKPWLFAIARNRCLSTLRSRREETALDFDLPTEGLTEEVERRAELRDLLRDLRELPADQRAALLLSHAGNLSHAEVADVLGCETAHVKALVFRARSGLIQRRDARETACEEIREQLANLRGNSLRRSALRHHLRSCSGCRAYREEVKRQRGLLAAALPVIPSLHLRSSVLAATGGGGGSWGGGLAAGLGSGLSASLGAGTVVKVAAVGLLVAGAATSGDTLVAHAARLLAPPPEAATRGPAFSSPKPSLARGLAGRPMELRAAKGPAEARGQEQRSDAAPSSAARPAGQGGPDQKANANSDSSAADAPGQDQPRGDWDDPDAIGSAPRARGQSGAPPAGTAPDRGPPADKGHQSADKGHPPADKGHPPADKGGPPSGIPGQAGPPERSVPSQGTPEPKASPETQPTIPEPAPVAAPKPAPALQPQPGPRPADKSGGPGS